VRELSHARQDGDAGLEELAERLGALEARVAELELERQLAPPAAAGEVVVLPGQLTVDDVLAAENGRTTRA